jgi:hypothetical protein
MKPKILSWNVRGLNEGGILTLDNLKKRHIIIAYASVMGNQWTILFCIVMWLPLYGTTFFLALVFLGSCLGVC